MANSGQKTALWMLGLLLPAFLQAEPTGFADPRHGYWTRPPQDAFSQLKMRIEAGAPGLITENPEALLRTLLGALKIPIESQMLVFSATSFQTPIISPRNPRAIYFNEDTYLGYVPGGRIEVVSIDPELGGIFYLFAPWAPGQAPQAERSTRCMNCHAPQTMGRIPALVVESMVPGLSGGGEKSFRGPIDGHSIPLHERFGGWHVTGIDHSFAHWGNLLMQTTPAGRQQEAIVPGQLFDWSNYPARTSDLLAHLLHEHQVGFTNRCIDANYRLRAASSPPQTEAELVRSAEQIVRYLLFIDEAALPPDSFSGDPAFKTAFLSNRKPDRQGRSLKDFELKSHLFRYRCSYMIYSRVFVGLPAELKSRIYRILNQALGPNPNKEFGILPAEERTAIAQILQATIPEFAKLGAAKLR